MASLTAILRSVPEQISELGNQYPDSVALVQDYRRLSFSELNNRVDKFAGYLAQLGVEPGGTVAICMERSFDWIVAALGIMRAGSAYVPLDLAWPDERIRFAVSNSEATIFVAQKALLDRLPVKARGVDPKRDAVAIAAAPALVAKPIDPESLAYVIYTSGSTGVPKGVEITHANLAHLVNWHQEAFHITPKDRASHLAGLAFDAAGWEIWPNLTAGATICIIEDEARTSPELIQQWMIREKVTIGFVPTVHAEPIMGLQWPESGTLRYLLTGGDALRIGPSLHLPFEVVNNYGPTECTVVATSGVIPVGATGTPTIGAPIAGTRIYLLDEQGQHVPDGTSGEIFIGGGSVGRGYRGLPEVTERSFLPDPFSSVPAARMYRTGDRGIRRPDGEIEFRGRLDRQVKIRGYRIELDEIGSVLTFHPSINFAAAVMHVPESGENQLIAYILTKESVSVPTAHELQEHLLRSMPDYMVPSAFIKLDAVPLSANGKIDLTKLPPPTEANMLARKASKAPASALEERVLALVRGLLENDAIGPEDNIFLAGGHSLLGMQLVIRLRNAFGIDVSLRQLFEAPTAERLAGLVEKMLLDAVNSMSEDQANALLTEYEREADLRG